MIYAILRCLHLFAVIVWVGGMLLMHFVVRPTLAAELEPPQRLLLMAKLLGSFFCWVTAAVATILVTGFAMMRMLETASRAMPPVYLHIMMGLGLVMALIFAWIRLREYPRLRVAVSNGNWPPAAATLARIRTLVAANLMLGVITVLVAVSGPFFPA